MDNPEVSIIIGAYNCGKFIRATISSVINQTFKNWELIIVDDNSTDDTFDIITRIFDKRIRILKTAKNSGLPAVPRNLGISNARGKYITFLDHDDIWVHDKLEIQTLIMNKDPSIALTFGIARFLDTGLITNKVLMTVGDKMLEYVNPITVSSVMVRKNVLEKIGGFNEGVSYKAVEDWDLWLRIAREKYKIKFIPKTLYFYRVLESSLASNSVNRRRMKSVLKKSPVYFEFFRYMVFIPYKVLDFVVYFLFFKLTLRRYQEM